MAAEQIFTMDSSSIKFGRGATREVGADMVRLGDAVDSQRPLAVIHAKDEASWQEAAQAIKAAIANPVKSLRSE